MARYSGAQTLVPSVRIILSLGWRSKTPPQIMNVSGLHHVPGDLADVDPHGAGVGLLCLRAAAWDRSSSRCPPGRSARSRACRALRTRSTAARTWGRDRAPSLPHMGGIMIPPRSPFSLAQRTSFTASSMSHRRRLSNGRSAPRITRPTRRPATAPTRRRPRSPSGHPTKAVGATPVPSSTWRSTTRPSARSRSPYPRPSRPLSVSPTSARSRVPRRGEPTGSHRATFFCTSPRYCSDPTRLKARPIAGAASELPAPRADSRARFLRSFLAPNP